MKEVLRYYRHISIVNPKNSTKPKISGREEIWCNGKKQVYYWNDPDFLMMSSLDDDLLYHPLDNPWIGFDPLFLNEPSDGIKIEPKQRSPRYINPDDVIIEPHPKLSHPFWDYQPIAKLNTAIRNSIKKVKKMAQNLPSALKTAWRELNHT